jgi:aryl-alcohol dehydrogenase-like predicted oxidoreductase
MTAQVIDQAFGVVTLGGDLTVNRLGFGAMCLTGRKVRHIGLSGVDVDQLAGPQQITPSMSSHG